MWQQSNWVFERASTKLRKHFVQVVIFTQSSTLFPKVVTRSVNKRVPTFSCRMSGATEAVAKLVALRLAPPLYTVAASLSRSWADAVRAATRQRQADLSLGAEAVSVHCENLVDGEHFPLNGAVYLAANDGADAVTRDRLRGAATVGCDCTDGCRSSHCRCRARSGSAYGSDGLLSTPADDAPIIECSAVCGCRETCSNRVVSRGLHAPLTVFKTASCGWGVRTRRPLRRGEFVCTHPRKRIISKAYVLLCSPLISF